MKYLDKRIATILAEEIGRDYICRVEQQSTNKYVVIIEGIK